ncbi:MAG: Gfo/Idh/MocA family oxidoreductase [Victivallales bacterium]|nr:Gfo/Idh/MocA family oxidoreductase [Victivallales bacterium]
MKNIKFAIVGCGNIAPFHAEGISNSDGAELVAVCDKDSARAAELAAKCSVDDYDDYAKMLEIDDLDVVNICLPSGLHEPLSVQAANAGKHVMVEKPLDITLEKCDSIINACRENNVKLATIFPSRFKPGSTAIAEAVAKGRFGRLTLGDASIKWFRSQEYYDSGNWRGTWKFDGGGALMNQSIHYIDVLQNIMGPVKSVTARCETLARKIEVEDTAVAIIKFMNGSIGTITGTTTAYPGLDSRIGIHGEFGSAILEGESLVVWKFKDELPEDDDIREAASKTKSSGAQDPTKNLKSEGHQLQVSDMVAAIRDDREPMVNGESGRKAVEIITGIYRSSREDGREVLLRQR